MQGGYSRHKLENVRQYDSIKPLQNQLTFSKIKSENRMPCVQKMTGDLCCKATVSYCDGSSSSAVGKNNVNVFHLRGLF